MLGGFFVVPLNALLQERGKKSVGAGNAIAVQNLGENSAMLLMLGLYSLAVLVGVPAVAIGYRLWRAVRAGDRGAVDLAAPAGIILSEYAGRRVRVIGLTLSL